ncbi:competence pheromone ComX [Paenibacillus albiflavus]|uniref:ComX pheromone n=1 Tax=Paenibacillus albiflavus TaxID=2545760 RepID=A0A4V2WPD4_9BACL|nr:competence pheromone ComX [Paenibacillus albiflavus]TCZ78932.1 competence pheromone ComX [Paenibacillus albiflavus]
MVVKKMVDYLMRNREVVTLVANGRASLVGVTSKEQQALIEVIGSPLEDNRADSYKSSSHSMHWYA